MKKEVKQFILLLSIAAVGGFLFTAWLIAYSKPLSLYQARQIVLAPEVVEKMNFEDLHPEKAEIVNYRFDHHEFVYFDYLKGKWQQKKVSLDKYAQFYRLIEKNQSIDQVAQTTVQLFNQLLPVALITGVRTEGFIHAKIFQVIQFVKEDYFRVKLQENEEESWVYFYQPNLYRSACHWLQLPNLSFQ